MSPITIERNPLGPRLHLFGRRVHECHTGLMLAGVAILLMVSHAAEVAVGALGLLAAWLVVKDWRDLHPATRDTAAWSLGLHRRPDGVPAPPARDRVPAMASMATALVGAINVGSVLAEDMPQLARYLLAAAPAGHVRLAHALALPGGLALLALALPILRRRRRALRVAIGLLAAVGAVNLVRSFDFDVAAVSWTLAGLLWWSRGAFWVEADPRHAGRVLRLSIGDVLERRRAGVLVRRHGADTLSAFKLRRDLGRIFSPDGEAMVGYRIKAGALLVAGDPVGPAGAIGDLMHEVRAFARRHGLALGAVGASREFADRARPAGLHRMYLGDEAILDAGPMDLSGGSRKSLRKAVNRVERHGFKAELHAVGDLGPALLAELESLSARWRGNESERGFSMALDTLSDDLLSDACVVLARDGSGRVRGFLHFVPVFSRRAVSLAFMRRDRDTPNGMTDFLVVEAARLLGDHGVDELSLNFSAFARWLREPANAFERSAARVLRVEDRWFQIERLLRFNAKFQPRWQPRYLLFAGATQLPRVALGAMWAEGQLPEPRLPRRAGRRVPAEPLSVP
jgi:lysyl-tRNA synthetase class 2